MTHPEQLGLYADGIFFFNLYKPAGKGGKEFKSYSHKKKDNLRNNKIKMTFKDEKTKLYFRTFVVFFFLFFFVFFFHFDEGWS